MIFVHGGPPRQMLLTWHYMDYYSNSYAVNQILASRGFAVLSVNYRLGIGYGHDFNFPARWGPTGASEYQDVVAGARYLQKDPRVDPARIGIWGGSYGGYLTALALARNSKSSRRASTFTACTTGRSTSTTRFGDSRSSSATSSTMKKR